MGLLEGLAGAVTGGALSFGGSALSAKLAREEAKKNRAFQERMRNTAYQAAMADMRKGGLNPILAYQRGGANTPQGSQALIPDFGKSGTAMAQAAVGGANVKKLSSATNLDVALIDKAKQETLTSASQQLKLQKETLAMGIAGTKGRLGDAIDRNVVSPLINWLEQWGGTAAEKYIKERKRRDAARQQSNKDPIEITPTPRGVYPN